MSFVIDTNVLMYAANEDCDEHEQCLSLLVSWRESTEPFYVPWPVAYEFLRITTHPRVLRTPWSGRQAWSFLATLAEARTFGFLAATERHQNIATSTFEELSDVKGNFVHDAHIAVLMREHGIQKIYTRDVGFHRFPFLEVIDPLRL